MIGYIVVPEKVDENNNFGILTIDDIIKSFDNVVNKDIEVYVRIGHRDFDIDDDEFGEYIIDLYSKLVDSETDLTSNNQIVMKNEPESKKSLSINDFIKFLNSKYNSETMDSQSLIFKYKNEDYIVEEIVLHHNKVILNTIRDDLYIYPDVYDD